MKAFDFDFEIDLKERRGNQRKNSLIEDTFTIPIDVLEYLSKNVDSKIVNVPVVELNWELETIPPTKLKLNL